MTKAEITALHTMTPDQLVEGFVRETKIYQLSDVPAANAALKKAIAFATKTIQRKGESSLEELMVNQDLFIAYSAADHWPTCLIFAKVRLRFWTALPM